MTTTGTSATSPRATSSTPSTVAPSRRAAVPAAWITGPSASGSENGTPSSSRSAPASAHASPTRRDSSMLGKPPIRYGISAARLPCERNASAIAVPLATAGLPVTEHLCEVLVAAARQRHEVELRPARVREEPRDRVRGLERRHDPLEARGALEGVYGGVVVDGDI